ncbi:MAG: rhodanese-like domain-containing protein [Gemmataceae bacterium]
MKNRFWTRALGGLSLLIAVGCALAPVAAAEHTKDSLETVKKSVADNKAVLLDVREKAEWDDGHLRDAKLLALSDLRRGVKADDLARILPKDKPVYCHCASGRRCLQAADILIKHGYDVRPLKAGYKDLLRSGFETAPK